MTMVSERLKRRWRELDVGYIGGAEDMTDDELIQTAAKLNQWARDRLDAGRPLLPANVCTKCFRPHQEHTEACTP